MFGCLRGGTRCNVNFKNGTEAEKKKKSSVRGEYSGDEIKSIVSGLDALDI